MCLVVSIKYKLIVQRQVNKFFSKSTNLKKIACKFIEFIIITTNYSVVIKQKI